MKQGINETVEAYATRIKKLLNKVAPNANDMAERFKVNYFMQGLSPFLISRVVAGEPATLAQAIILTKRLESGDKIAVQSMTTQVLQNSRSLQVNQDKEYNRNQDGNRYVNRGTVGK